MIWIVTFGTFLATVNRVCLLVLCIHPQRSPELLGGSSNLAEAPDTDVRDGESFAEKQLERVQALLVSVGKLFPGSGATLRGRQP